VFGGQVGVADNLTVGSDVIAGGASKILSNVPSGRAVLGYPAVKMETHVESYKALRRLPRLAKTVADLQKAVSKLAGND
jgi:UDP-3-O-[3-hydroxymyristoyl] glucosamine N-acyltransferase